MATCTPTDVQIKNDLHEVQVTWSDGASSHVPIKQLRGFCPCAECQEHRSGIRWINNETKHISQAQLVGRYAINFHFADGHKTGIFRWDYIRELADKAVVDG